MHIIDSLTLKFPNDGANTIQSYDRMDEKTKHKAGGYGYDKVGTVLANWITTDHQELLKPLRRKCANTYGGAGRYKYRGGEDSRRDGKLYGATYYTAEDRISFDGACGVSSLESFLEAAGLSLVNVGGTPNTSTYLLVKMRAGDTLWGYEPWNVRSRRRKATA